MRMRSSANRGGAGIDVCYGGFMDAIVGKLKERIKQLKREINRLKERSTETFFDELLKEVNKNRVN